ncbi:MAG: DUF4139 domain-containing protein [Pseudomonadota bacterium]
MRGLVVLFLLPGMAAAEVVELSFPVSAAEVFPQGARLTAETTVTLPAGDHELVVLLPPSYLSDGFRPDVGGAALRYTIVGENTEYDAQIFDTPAQAAARADLGDARAGLMDAERELAALTVQIDALEAAADVLRSVRGGDALPSPVELAQVAGLISTELVALAEETAALEAELPPLIRAVETADAVLERAAARLAALGAPEGRNWPLATLGVRLQDAGEVTVSHVFTDPGAGWSVSYDAALADALVTLDRVVEIRHGAGVAWVDADVTLSTAVPSGAMEAQPVFRDVARIGEEGPVLRSERMDLGGAVAEVAAAPLFAMAETDGPVVSYRLAEPVTVLLDGQVSVALPPVAFAAERYLAAAPRFDSTAFHMAEITNATGEPILPGPVRLSRDGGFVGESFLPAIAAGAQGRLGFGPEPDVALTLSFLDQQEGDRGIIRGRQTRSDALRVTAENLGETEREVRLRYAVPTSQQEDLEIDVETSPQATEENVDDLLGVLEWQLTFGPTSAQTIALDFDISWPEGQTLLWTP